MEHLGLLLPAGRGHHPGPGAGGVGGAAAGPGARPDAEPALPPGTALRLPVAVSVRQAGPAVRGPAARRAQECRPDALLHHRRARHAAAAGHLARGGLEGDRA